MVILAPNWLGDAVMALPAIADVRRGEPDASIAIAARPSIAPLFALVPEVDDTIVLGPSTALGARPSTALGARPSTRLGARPSTRLGARPSALLGAGAFDTALLLPNSMHAALLVSRARIPQRWGYRTQLRGPLLTRAIDPPSGVHQVEYYLQLAHALGFPHGGIEPRVTVGEAARAGAAALLQSSGWDGRAPLVAIAPGAAYGGAKRWPPEHFAELTSTLAADGVRTVMIGSAADANTARDVGRPGLHPLIDLVGKTDLPTLAGVLACCRTLVTNDSGAMHLAAAVGIPVTAVFGPTRDVETRPIGDRHAIITNPVWCRPCMLRECPLDHRCLRDIDAATVAAAARRTL
jgi:heptosyltransferase-2